MNLGAPIFNRNPVSNQLLHREEPQPLVMAFVQASENSVQQKA